jgi:PAS domain S-box-containing protein
LSDRPSQTSGAFPPAAAWWTDARGAFIAFSPRWETLVGRELAKELGNGWLDGVHPDDLAVWERCYRTALAAGSEFRCDLRLRSGTRWAWLRMHGLPQRDAAGLFSGYAGSATDVSDLKRAADAAEELLQSAIHDLRAPLRNLAHALESLARDTADQAGIERARGLARSLDALLHDLLDYAAAGRAAPQAQGVDPGEALAWARTNLAPLIEQTRAEIEVAPLLRVRVDPIHLGRVFQNLLSNALIHAGGREPRIRIDARREADAVCISVRDGGPGIPAAARETIFGAFQRLSGSAVPGSGLGLAICQRLVESHGGRIWVESHPGPGASFCFTLPAAD